MKNKLVLFLCGLLCFSNVITVTATEYTSETDNAKVPLLFTKESIFSVTLPESISGGNSKNVNFNYTVEGDIAANNKITINVEDNDTETEGIQLILSDALGLTKKADISIEQTEFSYDEITDGLTKNGNVTFTDLTAGKWSGIAKFIIDMNIQEIAGIYDENGVLLCSWEDSGINAEKNYSTYSDDDNYYQTSTTSGYYVITNNYPTATKIVLPTQ